MSIIFYGKKFQAYMKSEEINYKNFKTKTNLFLIQQWISEFILDILNF